MEGKSALDSHAVRSNPPHRKSRIGSATVQANHHTLERLNALAVALNDAVVHSHGVAGAQGRDIRIRFRARKHPHNVSHVDTAFPKSHKPEV